MLPKIEFDIFFSAEVCLSLKLSLDRSSYFLFLFGQCISMGSELNQQINIAILSLLIRGRKEPNKAEFGDTEFTIEIEFLGFDSFENAVCLLESALSL